VDFFNGCLQIAPIEASLLQLFVRQAGDELLHPQQGLRWEVRHCRRDRKQSVPLLHIFLRLAQPTLVASRCPKGLWLVEIVVNVLLCLCGVAARHNPGMAQHMARQALREQLIVTSAVPRHSPDECAALIDSRLVRWLHLMPPPGTCLGG
jgi:hypothetical protein